MTLDQERRERLDVALLHLEEAVDAFDSDEASTLLAVFEGKLRTKLKGEPDPDKGDT